MDNNDVMKNARLLDRQLGDITKALDVDHRQRTVSIAVLVFMVFAAFFISLADASFDWKAIGTAKFWIDFTLTFGGGQFLKYVWGKLGIYEGHQDPAVKEEMLTLSINNKTIKNNGLVTRLKDFIKRANTERKYKAFRDKVYKEALRRPKSAFWIYQKETIRIYERYEKEPTDELKRELEDRNFDIDTLSVYKYSFFGLIPHKLKYSKINDGSIGTGYEDTDSDDGESLEFNEMYQLYGKNAMFTAATTGLSFLVSIVGFSSQEFSMAVFVTFVSRVFVYVLNSYVGYTTGKTAVEMIKLNVLKRINNFLATFLEANKNTQEVSE